jgi:hypothetical protein
MKHPPPNAELIQVKEFKDFLPFLFSLGDERHVRFKKNTFEEHFPFANHIWVQERGCSDRQVPKYGTYRQYICRWSNQKRREYKKKTNNITKCYKEGVCDARLTIKYYEAEQEYEIYHTKGKHQHSHSIEESHARKVCTGILQQVHEQSALGYKSEQVHKVVLRMNENTYGDQCKYLNINHALSSRQRNFTSMQESDRPKDDIQNDIGDALRYLDTIVVDENKENTYSYRYYVRANIFVFANTIQLELLAKQGNIFLMDSTHDLNHWKWYFFTIYIRDKSGQWPHD